MDSLGEVGKKMRSAIKAKLVELGNASSTGYIDDELPDYVMIMVANKRSKQQMLADLNLFLGSNTETFVTWLHQVLQKLQEVTLPTNLATKAKKKIGDSSGKKDKKKDKKKAKEPSITDVIAVELMEKAKKTIDPKLKCEKSEKSDETPSPPHAPQIINSPERNSSSSKNNENDLNFPTISQIQAGNNAVLHRKELENLGETVNKINVTKRKLISLTNSERSEKSSDRDVEMSEVSPQPKTSSVKSRLGTKTVENNAASKSANIISLSAIRRSETEFLKKIVVKQKEDNDYRSSTKNRTESSSKSRRERRSRSTSRDRYRNNRDRIRRKSRSRSPIKSHENKTRVSIRQRIGERINITQAAASTTNKHSKTPETDGNFKVKQRPALSSTITAHAGKSLLLRAMADAQKSTQSSSEAKKKQQQRENIVVQVKNEKRQNAHENIEEYVPESISGHSESEAEYHPSYKNSQETVDDDGDVIYLNNNDDADLDDLDDNNEMRASPQFIITLSNKEKSKSKTPPPKVIKRKTPVKERIGNRIIENNNKINNDAHRTKKRVHQDEEMEVEECESQRAYNKVKKARVSPIKFDLTDDEEERDDKSRSSSHDRSDKKSSTSKNDSDHNGDEHSKKIKLDASRSFDHVPSSLSSVAVPVPDSLKPPVVKSKERCKFYPNCSNSKCIFYHPTLQCKAFPNCKFGDSCAYVHPICKFDPSCNRAGCNYSHSTIAPSTATPLIASSIVPTQNYKSIKISPTMTLCKFYPNCVNTNCVYQHPKKLCKYGKSCVNKYECNFFHFETASQNKFKWVSSSS